MDAISGIQSLSPVIRSEKTGQQAGGFDSILEDAINNAEDTDAASQEGAMALLTGDVNDISGTVIAAEKADVALRLTIQVRNKVIDAYNEIMRMQL
jgi:flagellar hook-basal body complex protein FliE